MKVSEAVEARTSIRAFLDKQVPDETIKDLLERAKRAPSGGNVQPWRLYVVNGDTTRRFLDYLEKRTDPETPAYEIYPKELKEPYRSSRFKVGEDMYALLGIAREDKPARFARLMENFRFFGAPCGVFCFVDQQMGPPQWSDLGMYLQTFMLLATEAGLATCAQEAWSTRPAAVASFVGAPADQMLFCGMAVGYADPDAPVNRLVSDREPFDVYASFVTP